MKSDEFSKAAWVRGVVLRRPNITLKQLQAEYDKGSSRPKDKRPKVMQDIYGARTVLCKRWGIKEMEFFPRNNEEKIVIAGMVRLYLDKFGFDETHTTAEAYFALDGISLSSGVFSNQKTVYREKLEEAEDKSKLTGEPGEPVLTFDDDSPDANQNTGSRARKEVPQSRRKPGLKSDTGVNMLFKLKECVTEAGGFDKVREALKTLERLQS